jgi:hypothetical protein
MARFSSLTDPLNGLLPPAYIPVGTGGLSVGGVNDAGVFFGSYWNNPINSQSQFLFKNGGFTLLNIPFQASTAQIGVSSFIFSVNRDGSAIGSYSVVKDASFASHG